MGASASKHKLHGSKRDVNRIPDRPSQPGKPQLVPGTSHSEPDVVTIRWEPPEYDGGSKIIGYLVEHRRTGSPHWVRASPTLVRIPELTLSGLEPGWRYQFRVSAKNSIGVSEPGGLSELLTVTLQRTAASAPHFVRELTDIVALENEKAEFNVEIRGTPAPTIAWYKDGLEIFSGRRYRIITESGTSALIIHQTELNDEGEIKCTATNRVGHAVTKASLKMEAPPSVRLPRQYEDGLLFEKDEVMRLKVTVAGRPVPSVSWLHNGEPLTNSGRYEMTFTDRFASLRVNEARRSDRGEYQVKAVNQLGEDVTSFLVTVTDRPQGPGKAKVVMTLGRSVTLSWTAPEDDGGCKIGNYIVEYYRLGWNMWLKAATCRQLTTTLGDLIEGSEYKFRVKAENPYGVSDPGDESDILFIPDPHRGLLTPPERREGVQGKESHVEDWLLDPYKRQRETTPGGSPTREHKKVKKKDRGKTPDRELFSPFIKHEKEIEFQSKQQTLIKNLNEQQDAPKVPKRKGKRKQELIKDDSEERIKEKIKVTDDIVNRRDDKRAKSEEGYRSDYNGSSELMLVLLPNSRATTEERESAKKGIIDSLKDETGGIAPPMSLSAPELGSIEPDKPLQRAWVSSTELLHEKAMARFYQAVAEEEAEKALQRRYSYERRSSSRTRDIISQQFIRNKSLTLSEEMLQDKSKKRFSLPIEELKQEDYESNNKKENSKNIKFYDDKEFNYDEIKKDIRVQIKLTRGLLKEQSSEEDKHIYDDAEMEEEIYDESETEEEEEEEEEYIGEEFEEEEEYEEDDEQEEEIDEEEIEEEEEEMDDIDMLGESEGEIDERPSMVCMDEETYHPRSMIPRRMNYTGVTSSPTGISTLPKLQKNIKDNLRNVTDVATAVVSHSITIPIKPSVTASNNLKPPEIPKSKVRIEVTPPPDDRKSKHIIKPIIKKSPNREVSPNLISVQVEINAGSPKKDYSPPRFTPDGRYLPNPNPAIPKPILKVRDNSQERILDEKNKSNENLKNTSAPIASVEAELNIITQNEGKENVDNHSKTNNNNNSSVTDSVKLKKKQVRIEEPEYKRSTSNLRDDDDYNNVIGLTGDVARNRRRSRSSSIIDESDPTKCVIHHYSDIVREFGKVKKAPKTLYLNYEDLKAAAQKSDENLIEPVIEIAKVDNNKNTIKYENKETQKYEEISDIDNIKTEINKDKIETEEFSDSDKRLEFLTGSKEIKQLANLILLSDVKTVEDVVPEVTTNVYTKEEINEAEKYVENETELDGKEEERIVDKEGDEVVKLAEKKIRSMFDYMTDLAMFVIACWLYAFSDERLAIPILILMIYRQAKDATVSYFKRQIARLPGLPRLPRLPKLPKIPWYKDE